MREDKRGKRDEEVAVQRQLIARETVQLPQLGGLVSLAVDEHDPRATHRLVIDVTGDSASWVELAPSPAKTIAEVAAVPSEGDR